MGEDVSDNDNRTEWEFRLYSDTGEEIGFACYVSSSMPVSIRRHRITRTARKNPAGLPVRHSICDDPLESKAVTSLGVKRIPNFH